MKVIKFGGSSISTVKRIKNVLEIIKSIRAQEEIIVVVSAFGGVTEKLIEMSTIASKGRKEYLQILNDLEAFQIDSAIKLLDGENNATLESVREKFKDLRNILEGLCLIKELSPKALDLIMSIGERLSAFLLAKSLTAQGIEAEYLNTCKVIKTDDNFGKANVNFELTDRYIRDYLKNRGAIQVVTGFIASTENDEITTLGRSGSDYTAAIFAAALQCSEIEIWTDVNGVMTADPKIVANAFPIESMTYEEAAEMAHFGSKVIHPKAMQPANEKGIQLRIRNTFQRHFSGTIIKAKSTANPFIIRGISAISGIALLRVQGSGLLGGIGVSARIFGALAKEQISVILITQGSSEHSICFAVTPDSARKAKKIIETEFSLEIYANLVEKVLIEDNLAVVAVVGEKMRGVPGIAARIFNAFGKSGINVIAIAQGSSELNISIVINHSDEFDALNALHEEFFIKNKTTLHLYFVGIGSVGGKLIEQIQQQKDYLEEQYSVEIKIHGIANSKKMIFDPKGLHLENWQDRITHASLSMNIGDFLETMKEFNFRNSIFIDCTSSEFIVKSYEEILKSGISIVTPNKKATSSSYAQYRELKNIASRRGVKFFYETNVGASLPIIRTLNDMTLSGDKVLKIEAIISGTISYIFNSFEGTRKD